MTPRPDWGPWSPGIDDTERAARCRALAAFIRVYAGPAGADAVAALRRAEDDPAALDDSGAALSALPTIPYRRAVAAFAALHSPRRTAA